MKDSRKILLCSPCWDTDGARNVELLDLYKERLTRRQGLFAQTGHCPFLALHLLAQNLSAPVTVLEYPTERLFLREIHQGYDWIGITLLAIDTQRVLRMCAQIRKHSPHSKIVLGGCGVPAVKETLASDSTLKSRSDLVDFFCEGEGVGYLRALLKQPTAAPIRQCLPPAGVGFGWFPYHYLVGNVVAGLGCPNGCPFCSTSAFFQGRYIELANARTIFECLKTQARKHPRLRMTLVFDEDFFRDKDRVMELSELIRSDREFGLRQLGYFTFSSIASLEQYSPEELALSGVSTIWIGAESIYSRLPKLGSHRIKQMFDMLHEHGVSTIGSWIIGLDVQCRENIEADLEAFIELTPTLAQIAILTPMSGTPLWESLKQQQRVISNFDWSRAHLHALNFRHATLDEQACLRIVERGHEELNARHGPTVLRDFLVHLNGLRYCLNSRNPALSEARAAYHRKLLCESFPILKAVEDLAAQSAIRDSVSAAADNFRQLVGPVGWRLRTLEKLVSVVVRRAHKRGFERPPSPLVRKYLYEGGELKTIFPGRPEMRLWEAAKERFENLVYHMMRGSRDPVTSETPQR